MKTRTLAIVSAGLLAAACTAADQQVSDSTTPAAAGVTAFVGARIIDGGGNSPIDGGVMLVRDGRIDAVGRADSVPIPDGAEEIDVAGRTIVPGLINTHGHVGDTVGLEAGHYSQQNVLDHLALYARYGITTVNSLGGDLALAAAVRDAESEPGLSRARLMFAGPVVTATTREEAATQVDEIAAMQPDFIKIRVDDNLGATTKMPPAVYGAVIEAAHAHELPLASHLFYLDDAKRLLAAGADFVAHSVRDQPVDDAFIAALVENEVCYSPTLTRELSTYVFEERPAFFDDPFFLAEADPAVVAALEDAERQARYRGDGPTAYKEALRVAMLNLKAVADGGATVAMGTDSGPPARFQGYFEHLELGLMAEAGLTLMQILVAATGDAARCIGRDDIGTLEPGKRPTFSSSPRIRSTTSPTLGPSSRYGSPAIACRAAPKGHDDGCRAGSASHRRSGRHQRRPRRRGRGFPRARALEGRVDVDMLANYETGARYHFYHSLGIIAVGLLALFRGTRGSTGDAATTRHVASLTRLRWSAVLMLTGIVLFSGSLYTMALTGMRWLGAVTPFGGVAFLAGWALLAWAALDE